MKTQYNNFEDSKVIINCNLEIGLTCNHNIKELSQNALKKYVLSEYGKTFYVFANNCKINKISTL